MLKRVLSGVQPTGNLTIGNYFGAIKNWINLQSDHDCLFCVVDLHSCTAPQSPAELRQNTRLVAAAYLASGIDPDKSSIFIQSQVSAHCELAWLLNCMTPLGWLNRMTQFKDKAGSDKEQANLGLYAYPVLMAADILLYKTTHVPVGEDQKQHLEITRDIAGAFNQRYQEIFSLPEPMIMGAGARVMSLRDGTKKMSKSDASDMSRINLMDSADLIAKKIKKAKTDLEALPGKVENLQNRPEARNLLDLYSLLTNQTLETSCIEFEGKQFSGLKNSLAEAMVAKIAPIGEKIQEFVQNQDYIDSILKKGAEKANAIAHKTLNEVKDVMGIVRF